MRDGLLSSIRIFDMTRVLAGPYCTAMLADLGAEVIKLEPPGGDEYRHIGPFNQGESALFQLMNRGKKSVVIDLKSDAGRKLAQDIALSCDVVVENFRPGVAAKLGLGAEELRRHRSSMIYASISGFGQTGPWTNKPAYDLVAQALSGFMAINGDEGGPPLKVGESIGDLAGGLYASWAILAALVKRGIAGQGSTIDVAMHDALFAMLPTAHAQFLHAGCEPQRVGNRHPLSTPFGCFKARDGMFVLAVLNEKHFALLAKIMGNATIADDPRFASDSSRTTHQLELKRLIEAWSSQFSVAEIVGMLELQGIPTAPIATFPDVVASEQAIARNFVTMLGHATLGSVPVVGQPVRFDQSKPVSQKAAPQLGSHTREQLLLLGLTDANVTQLIEIGVVREANS